MNYPYLDGKSEPYLDDICYLVMRMKQEFPSLFDSSDCEISGADVVDFLTSQINEMELIHKETTK